PWVYGVVEMTAAVGIVALDPADRVVLVGQYRYPTDRYSWEIVAGYANPGANAIDAARRELREETGLDATDWTALGSCQVSNSVTDQIGHLFLARGLTTGAPAPDATEDLRRRWIPFADALALAQSGEIDQAFSLV